MGARVFPWERLPRVGRDEAGLMRRCARRLPLAGARAAAAVLGEILGTQVRVRPRPLGVVAPREIHAAAGDPLVAVVLVAPGCGHVAIELDPGLAACVVDRALGGTAGDDVPEPWGPLDDVERGVLAFVAARAVARSEATAWRIAGVATAPAALQAAIGDDGAVVWPVEVAIGSDTGVARAWLPEVALGAPATGDRSSASWLARLALTMVVEGARGTLARDDLSALRAGDVVVLDETWLVANSDGFGGEVRVRANGAARTVFRCAVEPGGVRVTGIERTEEAPVQRGRVMEDTDVDATDRAVALAGDAEVQVSVEIARFTIPLEELASLRAGEVVLSGRPIGERVVLRAGDRAVASGELVDVDGEVGVRLLSVGAE